MFCGGGLKLRGDIASNLIFVGLLIILPALKRKLLIKDLLDMSFLLPPAELSQYS